MSSPYFNTTSMPSMTPSTKMAYAVLIPYAPIVNILSMQCYNTTAKIDKDDWQKGAFSFGKDSEIDTILTFRMQNKRKPPKWFPLEKCRFCWFILLEISLQQAFQSSAMTSLVSNYVINRNPKFPYMRRGFYLRLWYQEFWKCQEMVKS